MYAFYLKWIKAKNNLNSDVRLYYNRKITIKCNKNRKIDEYGKENSGLLFYLFIFHTLKHLT